MHFKINKKILIIVIHKLYFHTGDQQKTVDTGKGMSIVMAQVKEKTGNEVDDDEEGDGIQLPDLKHLFGNQSTSDGMGSGEELSVGAMV